jgi:hypothetical protein
MSNDEAHESFDEWLARIVSPARRSEPLTFEQYARYIEGWQKSKPWSYRGMSVAYFHWAESKWDEIQDMERLHLAWREGMALVANAVMINDKKKKDDPDNWIRPIDQAWRGKPIEEAADFMLTFRDTLVALISMHLNLRLGKEAA